MYLFEDYSKENKLFLEGILINIAKALKLKSDDEHERYIEEFEKNFANYNNSKYVVGVNSGTAALSLALRACGVGRGDEVVLSPYTYIASALSVSDIGAKPVFCDIKEDTLTINPQELEKKITKKTKAIITVHIHGNPCAINEIIKIAQKDNLTIIEDASHAHGAEYRGLKVGNFGIGCFSNHASKILSGVGNSGLITTNNNKIYESIKKMIKVTGEPDLNLSHRTPCKINVLQAAVLKIKLSYLDKLISMRRMNASLYIKNLSGSVKFQKEENNAKNVYRDFVIMTEKRDELKKYLDKIGIATAIRYSTPLHLTKYYKYLGYKKGIFPVTEETCKKTLHLPVSYPLSKKDVEYICQRLKF